MDDVELLDRKIPRRRPYVPSTVSRDGPNSVACPMTAQQWAALGVQAPTHLYLCQNPSGSIPDEMGVANATIGGAGHLFDQVISGWSRKFVGFPDAQAGANWQRAARVIGSTQSVAMLIYAAFTANASTRLLAGACGNGLGANTGPGIDAAGSVNTPRLSANAVTQAGGSSHAGITTVRPYLFVRDAANDLTRLYTDLEQVNVTHWEGASSSAIAYIGATGGSTRESRYGYWALWEPTEAAALIAAGYGNKTLLQTLGWSIPY
jgi:hypothetical protein